MWRWFGGVTVALAVLTGLAGCELLQKKGHTVISVAVTNSPSYGADVLQVGETLRIYFKGPMDLESRGPVDQRIKDDGTVSLQYIGSIPAAGKKAKELEEIIQKLYVPRIYQHLTVNVQYADRFYYVGGQVRNPNKFIYAGEVTILKAIDSAGGFTDYAKKWAVIIKRANGAVEEVDCGKALEDSKLDIKIYPNDKIEVPMRIL